MFGAKSKKAMPAPGEPHADARERLATAVAAAAEAEAIRAEEDAATLRAQEMVRTAEADLAKAVADVAEAREALTAGMIAAAKNGAAATSDGTLAAARQREDQARDVLDAAREALASVTPQVTNQEIRRAAERLHVAAADVIRPLIEPTIEEAMRAHRDWIEARRKLHFLHAKCFPEVNATPESHHVLNVANGKITHTDAIPKIDERWLQAFETLKRDASAPLPWEA